jgi:folate-binding protein YgfZ
VAAGRPAWGREVAPPHLPEELGLLPTHVHLAKGCYPGQEAVARMWMLGRPRRRLARVRVADIAGAQLPVAPGWSTGEGRETVEVTCVADDGTALAFVPGAAEPGSTVTTTDAAITVLEVVGDDPVPPGHDPAMKRRRDRDRSAAEG